MTITLDSWQPVLVAIIGALAALGVPIVSAIISSRSSRKASEKATQAAATAADSAATAATEIGDKVDKVADKLDKHANAVAQMGVKINGERTELLNKIAQQEQVIIQMRQRASEQHDAR